MFMQPKHDEDMLVNTGSSSEVLVTEGADTVQDESHVAMFIKHFYLAKE